MLISDEHQMIQQAARQFANEQLIPNTKTWSEQSYFPKEAVQEMGKLGFMGMLTPESFDGCDVGYLAYVLVMEEIARGDAALSTILGVHNSMGCLPIVNYGSQFLKDTYLRPMAQGEKLGAFCLTEPEAGSDARNLKTTAELKDGYYTLNGTKQFITSGKNADIGIVFAVTDPTQGAKGISAFVVPTHTPGYIVAKCEKKMGQHASEIAQLVFDNCKIPADHLLGKEGEGYKIALGNLEFGRMGIAAQAIGVAQRALELSLQYAKERVTFGKPLKDHQAIAFRLADMATELQAARQLTWHAASLKDNNLPCKLEACQAKLFATEKAENICNEAIQIHGGYGYLHDFMLEQLYRDVRVSTIYEGTSDIQKMIISRELLK